MSIKNVNYNAYRAILLLLPFIGVGVVFADQNEGQKATIKLKALSESQSADDITQIHKLIKAGADVNVKNKYGLTPLMTASMDGHAEIARLLIEKNANVNLIRSADKFTAILFASQNGHAKIVSLLLEANANINAANKDGVAPLWVACLKGHYDIVKLLLKAHASVDVTRNVDGTTPLFVASVNCHAGIVKLILEANADVNATNKENGATSLLMASQNGCLEVIKLLIKANADVNAEMYNGTSPLWMASQNGYTEIVKYLLEAGADVNAAVKENGVTPLYIAVYGGHAEVVKVLLEYNADLNSEALGYTPLTLARAKNHKDIVSILNESQNNFIEDTRVRLEELEWSKAEVENTVQAYKRFLKDYPDGLYLEDCLYKIWTVYEKLSPPELDLTKSITVVPIGGLVVNKGNSTIYPPDTHLTYEITGDLTATFSGRYITTIGNMSYFSTSQSSIILCLLGGSKVFFHFLDYPDLPFDPDTSAYIAYKYSTATSLIDLAAQGASKGEQGDFEYLSNVVHPDTLWVLHDLADSNDTAVSFKAKEAIKVLLTLREQLRQGILDNQNEILSKAIASSFDEELSGLNKYKIRNAHNKYFLRARAMRKSQFDEIRDHVHAESQPHGSASNKNADFGQTSMNYIPDGTITFVDEAANIVYLNLGSGNGIYKGLTFKVYDQGTIISKDGIAKAKIEIIMTAKETSMARIISIKPTESISSGDLFINLIWRNQRRPEEHPIQ